MSGIPKGSGRREGARLRTPRRRLVALSCALLVGSLAWYVAAVPAMTALPIDAARPDGPGAPQTDGGSPFNVFGLLGGQGASAAGDGGAASSGQGGTGAAAASARSGAGTAAKALSGVSGVSSGSGSGAAPGDASGGGATDGGSANGGGSGTNGGSGTGSTGGSGTTGGGSGTTTDPSTPPDPVDPNPAPSGPAEAEEQATYAFLKGKADLISGYVDRVNAVTADFDRDKFADLSTRRAHAASSEALSYQLLDEYLDVRDRADIANESRYRGAQGTLIAMFRCLAQYTGTMSDAWSVNTGFDDPAAHASEFMPIAQGAQGYLDEYGTWAGQLEL